jgi:hypothetical protein
MKMTDHELAVHITEDLSGPCSMANYLGFNLPRGKHTTLGNSALGFNASRERRKNAKLLQRIRKTCQVDYKTHLLNKVGKK